MSFGARDLSVVRGCPLFGSCKCIASTGIAVIRGMSAIGSVRYRRFHCISLLQSNSDHFYGDSSGLSYLLVSVYMPTYYDPSCVNVYLNVLGKLEGFIASQGCDVNIIAGDFNMDFDRGGQLLKDFMTGLDLHACDLNFRSSVNYIHL